MLTSKQIEKKLHLLSPRERTAVTHRFGLHGKPKLRDEEIAELIRNPGLSTSSVRGLISSALQKLRDATPLSEPIIPRSNQSE